MFRCSNVLHFSLKWLMSGKRRGEWVRATELDVLLTDEEWEIRESDNFSLPHLTLLAILHILLFHVSYLSFHPLFLHLLSLLITFCVMVPVLYIFFIFLLTSSFPSSCCFYCCYGFPSHCQKLPWQSCASWWGMLIFWMSGKRKKEEWEGKQHSWWLD